MQSTVDHGWSWVVLTAVFCNNAIIGMQYGSVSIFYTIFLQVFDESRTFTSWLGSLNSIMLFSSGSLASYLLPKIGIRNVIYIASFCVTSAYVILAVSNSLVITILAYGIFGGIGFGFALTGGVAAIARYFDRHLYKASSISLIGTGVGGITYGPLLELLIEVYGWRGAALIFSGVSLQLFVVASTVFPVRSRSRHLSELICDDVTKNLDKSTVKTTTKEVPLSPNVDNMVASECKDATLPLNASVNSSESQVPKDVERSDKGLGANKRFFSVKFWCLSYMGFTWGFCSLPFVSSLKDIISSAGLVEHFAMAMVAMGLANTASRITVCFLTFKNILLSYLFILLLGGIIIPLYAVVTTYWTLLVASLFSGFYLGASYVMLPVSVGAIYGRQEMATTYGYVLFSVGMSNLGGPSLIGYLRDLTGVYNSSLYLLGAVQLTGAVMAGFIHFRMKVWAKAK